MKAMKVIAIRIPDDWLRLIEERIRAGEYPNRSELIRAAIEGILKNG